jgi:hypothetical protein
MKILWVQLGATQTNDLNKIEGLRMVRRPDHFLNRFFT